MNQGDTHALSIDRLSLGGEGVGRLNGKTVFVPYSAPGDQLEIRITEDHPRYARAELIRVIQASSQRIEPPCPYHFRTDEPRVTSNEAASNNASSLVTRHFPAAGRWCGGCSWQHLAYPAQLEAKRMLVQETLERIGGLKGIIVKPVLGMKDPWRYRNKVQQPVGFDGNNLVTGFYAPGSHDILPITECLVQTELSVAIINRTREILRHFGIRAYSEARHQGWIRHLLVRTAGSPTPITPGVGPEGSDPSRMDPSRALLTFVTRTPEFPHEQDVIQALNKDFPQILGFHQNVQNARSNVILGREWRTLAGQDWIEERLGRLRFRLSPASFFQVNSAQAEILYDVARQFAGKGRRLLDLYCGVGAIALWLADQFEEVGGVEEVEPAIVDAQANAELNGIQNARFLAQPVEAFLRGARHDSGRGLTVTLDPPRTGCAPAVVQALVKLRPERIVYVSCDPGTLARDVKVLVQGGYQVDAVQPVDLFPQTAHIETVVKLNARM